MARSRKQEQFTIAGMLFLIVGFAVFCVATPYLHASSRMSPSWAWCIGIELMFAWAMIPLRQGTQRIWWIGFLLFGCLYLTIALVIVPAVSDHVSRSIYEPHAALLIFAVTLAGLPLCGALGHILFWRFRRRVERQHIGLDCATSRRG